MWSRGRAAQCGTPPCGPYYTPMMHHPLRHGFQAWISDPHQTWRDVPQRYPSHGGALRGPRGLFPLLQLQQCMRSPACIVSLIRCDSTNNGTTRDTAIDPYIPKPNNTHLSEPLAACIRQHRHKPAYISLPLTPLKPPHPPPQTKIYNVNSTSSFLQRRPAPWDAAAVPAFHQLHPARYFPPSTPNTLPSNTVAEKTQPLGALPSHSAP